jgi:DNA-binding transcriptional LysR family regulator
MPAPDGLDLIPTFMIVAEELSFSRSAERLNINQSALSRRIQKLEQQLDFPLFERTTRDVSLTPPGRAFYEDNIHLLQDFSSSIDQSRLIAEGKTGRLRIAYMTFAGLRLMPQAVALYREKFPYVAIHTRKLGTQDQKLAMANDELDIGYMIGPFNHSDFRTLVVKTDPLYVVMPARSSVN